MPARTEVPDWEMLLAHAARLQTSIPGAVLVGGTAAAVHARHRFSVDHDHVVRNLEKTYERSLAALEAIAGWRTTRRIRGKLILGHSGGIAAGLRNQRRKAPLETIEIEVSPGRRIRLPTVEEMLRVKALLVVERNATRDYLDVAALSYQIGLHKGISALQRMNDLYGEFAGDGGDMLTSLMTRLAAPAPYDLTDVDLAEYKGIVAPWDDWRSVEEQCRNIATGLLQAAT